jgi:hypothetical protein
VLINRNDSHRAARALLARLKGKGGKCSKAEMGKFAYGLEAGEVWRFSRRNFCAGVLRRFLDLGLIAELPEYDRSNRKVVKSYRVVYQPIPRHRPMSPSFAYLSHLICEAWNKAFVATESEGYRGDNWDSSGEGKKNGEA